MQSPRSSATATSSTRAAASGDGSAATASRPVPSQVQSPPTAPGSPRSSNSSYSGQLYSYLYNGAASLSNAVNGEAPLTDDQECFVNGQCYRGPKTKHWATDAVRCCPYFTYRRSLPVLLSSGGDHDAGWGCMIRTAQMMMCQCLRRLFRCERRITTDPIEYVMLRKTEKSSGGEARSSPSRLLSPRPTSDLSPLTSPKDAPAASGPTTDVLPSTYSSSLQTSLSPPAGAQPSLTASASGAFAARGSSSGATASPFFLWVQDLFMDTPSAPFGLYKFTEAGATVGCPVGSWFGPSTVARSLPQLVAQCPQVNEKLTVIAALDGTVRQSKIIDELLLEEKAVLLLVPLMLGMGSVGKTYEAVILHLLELPQSLGLVGGKPSKSLYFVGHQGDLVFFLDPHVVQPAFVSRATVGALGGPRGTAPVQSLDPCMLACFYFEREEDFFQWADAMAVINREGEFPIITIKLDPTAVRPSSLRVECNADDARFVASPRDTRTLDDCDFDEEDL